MSDTELQYKKTIPSTTCTPCPKYRYPLFWDHSSFYVRYCTADNKPIESTILLLLGKWELQYSHTLQYITVLQIPWDGLQFACIKVKAPLLKDPLHCITFCICGGFPKSHRNIIECSVDEIFHYSFFPYREVPFLAFLYSCPLLASPSSSFSPGK